MHPIATSSSFTAAAASSCPAGACASRRRRCRLEMQGFRGVADADLRAVDLAARLAPALCVAWAAVATARGSAVLLGALVPWALLGAALPRHPFDLLYGLARRFLGTPALPRHGAPRRFACAVATLWLAVAATSLAVGAVTVGCALGLVFVAVAAVPVTIGFCVPSWPYGRLRSFARRANARQPRSTSGATAAVSPLRHQAARVAATSSRSSGVV